MAILVTGGAGYIGSHLVKSLVESNQKVVVFDNLSRGHIEAIPKDVQFDKIDLLDKTSLSNAIKKYEINSVIHFAAFAYVGESVENPLLYYQNNVVGSYNLIQTVIENSIDNFVFSSTCSIYGNDAAVPINENEKPNPINPYAKTKLMIEQMLEDLSSIGKIKYAALRYFNAAGASMDESLGESHDPEPHLIPLILHAALGKRNEIGIFGTDYPTEDGTCIRDYIHVEDLADAHIRALHYLESEKKSLVVNLGTGSGNSVLEVIEKSKKITGREIRSVVKPRRTGDPSILVADNSKAKQLLNWTPRYFIEEIIESAWRWHSNQKY